MARIDEQFKTPLARAKARAKRNARHIRTPEKEYKRYFKFQAACGAYPGSKGDKVVGRAIHSYSHPGIFVGTNKNDGASVLRVLIKWMRDHKRQEWRDDCRNKALMFLNKKINQVRCFVQPKLENI